MSQLALLGISTTTWPPPAIQTTATATYGMIPPASNPDHKAIQTPALQPGPPYVRHYRRAHPLLRYHAADSHCSPVTMLRHTGPHLKTHISTCPRCPMHTSAPSIPAARSGSRTCLSVRAPRQHFQGDLVTILRAKHSAPPAPREPYYRPRTLMRLRLPTSPRRFLFNVSPLPSPYVTPRKTPAW